MDDMDDMDFLKEEEREHKLVIRFTYRNISKFVNHILTYLRRLRLLREEGEGGAGDLLNVPAV